MIAMNCHVESVPADIKRGSRNFYVNQLTGKEQEKMENAILSVARVSFI